jgi:FixJ family two-component response regulator
MNPRTPVGMITGWGVMVDQVKMDESGIDFLIPKPFQFNQISRVVGEAVASKSC